MRDKKLSAGADAAGVAARLGRAQGRRLADVHRHDDDAQGRRPAASGMIVQSGNDASVALAEGVGGSLENFVAHDEPPGAGLGPEEHAVQERHRPDRAGPLQHARDVAMIAAQDHHRLPGLLPLLLDPPVHLQQASSRTTATCCCGRDPTVDGMKTGYTDAAGYCLVASAVREMPNGKRRLRQRGAGHGLARGARQREPEAAELGLPGLGRGAPVRGRQADRHRAGVEGQGRRGQARRARRACSSPCPRARATS